MIPQMYLSDQAIAAIMMALQKSLMEQSDIVPTLKDFKISASDHGLIVTNPPVLSVDSVEPN
jgi:hypothetical protein